MAAVVEEEEEDCCDGAGEREEREGDAYVGGGGEVQSVRLEADERQTREEKQRHTHALSIKQ